MDYYLITDKFNNPKLFLINLNHLNCFRYTLLLGAGDKKDEVATAARNALYSAIRRANNQVIGIQSGFKIFLNFIQFIQFVMLVSESEI